MNSASGATVTAAEATPHIKTTAAAAAANINILFTFMNALPFSF